jgi:predicted nucleic acid-binding protein
VTAAPIYELDANILLRFLRNDHADHSPRAARLIREATEGKAVLRVSAVTVAEAFYALKVSYKVPRRVAAQTLASALGSRAFRLSEPARILDSLVRVIAANVDFGDAYLASTAAEAGIDVASFDRDIDRFKDIKRFEP